MCGNYNTMHARCYDTARHDLKALYSMPDLKTTQSSICWYGETGDQQLPVKVTHAEATAAIETVMRFFEQSDMSTPDDMQPLSAIRRRVEAMRGASLKQASILKFFK